MIRWIVWYLAFFAVAYCMVMDAQGARMASTCKLVHLEELDVAPGTLKGLTFQTTDGKCWELYKVPCISVSSPQLHAREVQCK